MYKWATNNFEYELMKANKLCSNNDCVFHVDVNECSTRSLHDCDVNLAQCSNTMGGFLCRCREGTSDVSSDVENRPGRQCRGKSHRLKVVAIAPNSVVRILNISLLPELSNDFGYSRKSFIQTGTKTTLTFSAISYF